MKLLVCLSIRTLFPFLTYNTSATQDLNKISTKVCKLYKKKFYYRKSLENIKMCMLKCTFLRSPARLIITVTQGGITRFEKNYLVTDCSKVTSYASSCGKGLRSLLEPSLTSVTMFPKVYYFKYIKMSLHEGKG